MGLPGFSKEGRWEDKKADDGEQMTDKIEYVKLLKYHNEILNKIPMTND